MGSVTVNRRLDFGDDLDHDLDADILTAFLPLRTSANSKNNFVGSDALEDI